MRSCSRTDTAGMTLEPWMIKTALVLAGINAVNLLLLWIARSRERIARTAIHEPMPSMPVITRTHRDAA